MKKTRLAALACAFLALAPNVHAQFNTVLNIPDPDAGLSVTISLPESDQTQTVAVANSMPFSFAAASAAEKAVSITGSIQPEAGKANHFEITVQLDISKGWHTYDDVGEGSEVPTSLELKLPKGVKAVGDWNRPIGVEGSSHSSLVYEGQVSFSRSVVVQSDAVLGENIDVIVSYQACTDQMCNRPQDKTISIVIPKAKEDAASPSLFDRPVRINVNGSPLNTVAENRFPSPAMFDVDGDGKTELVIGGLMGSLGIYENVNEAEVGDPVWGEREELEGVSGKSIRTSNW